MDYWNQKIMEYAEYQYDGIGSKEWVTTERRYSYDGARNRTGFSANEYVVTKYNDPGAYASPEKTYPLINQNYVYDRMGRLASIQDNWGMDSGLSPDIVKYDYDASSRIKNVYYPRKSENLPLRTYEYNKAGMVNKVSNYNAQSTDITPDLISSFAYSYQLDGNSEAVTKGYKYDYKNRLIETDTHSYV